MTATEQKTVLEEKRLFLGPKVPKNTEFRRMKRVIAYPTSIVNRKRTWTAVILTGKEATSS